MRRRPERRPRPARRTPARCPRAAAARPCRREAAPWARGWRRPAPPQRDGPRLQLARVVEQPVELDVDRHQRLLSLGFELHDQVVYERLAGLRSGAGDGHADQVGGDRGGAALRRMRRDARHLEDRLDLALADGGRGGTEERADLLDELLHGSSSLERAALAGTWVRSPYPIGRPSPPGRAAWNAGRRPPAAPAGGRGGRRPPPQRSARRPAGPAARGGARDGRRPAPAGAAPGSRAAPRRSPPAAPPRDRAASRRRPARRAPPRDGRGAPPRRPAPRRRRRPRSPRAPARPRRRARSPCPFPCGGSNRRRAPRRPPRRAPPGYLAGPVPRRILPGSAHG